MWLKLYLTPKGTDSITQLLCRKVAYASRPDLREQQKSSLKIETSVNLFFLTCVHLKGTSRTNNSYFSSSAL